MSHLVPMFLTQKKTQLEAAPKKQQFDGSDH
jgi:hypothetical protein